MTINLLKEWGDKTGGANVATGWQREDGDQLAGREWQSIGWRGVAIKWLGEYDNWVAGQEWW